jgi:putative photosynthetic complex assembly protein
VSDPFHGHSLPRAALWGAGVLLAGAILASGAARLSGVGTTRMPAAAAVASVELRFLDGSDGSVRVHLHPEGTLVATLPAGTHGFARGVLRGLARDRRLQHLDSGPPFRLVRWSDGRLSLEDPATRRSVALEAFGPTNAQVFADLLLKTTTTTDGGRP